MSYTERGIYITLLSQCWLGRSLPSEPKELATMLRLPVRRFAKLWAGPLGRCFYKGEDGRLYQGRLEVEREKQEQFRRRQGDAGRASAASRFNRGSTVVQPHANPRVEESKEQTDPEKRCGEKPADEIGLRAGQLIERYRQQWYPKYRHGARLRLVGSPIEFDDACSLCLTWDDARLEKLAQIVLTTNDDFIAGTDRSFRIFALKASWADDRLKQAEQA